eukprot:6478199-Amphidinium_carterae.2
MKGLRCWRRACATTSSSMSSASRDWPTVRYTVARSTPPSASPQRMVVTNLPGRVGAVLASLRGNCRLPPMATPPRLPPSVRMASAARHLRPVRKTTSGVMASSAHEPNCRLMEGQVVALTVAKVHCCLRVVACAAAACSGLRAPPEHTFRTACMAVRIHAGVTAGDSFTQLVARAAEVSVAYREAQVEKGLPMALLHPVLIGTVKSNGETRAGDLSDGVLQSRVETDPAAIDIKFLALP